MFLNYFNELREQENLNENNKMFLDIKNNVHSKAEWATNNKLKRAFFTEMQRQIKLLVSLGEYRYGLDTIKQEPLEFRQLTYLSPKDPRRCFINHINLSFYQKPCIEIKYLKYKTYYGGIYETINVETVKVDPMEFTSWFNNYYKEIKQLIKDGILVKK